MFGTGLTFAVGVGLVAAAIGAAFWLGGEVTGREVAQIAGRSSVAAFLLGVAFSGVLAISARGRQFSKLSLRLVGSLGAGAGLLYFLFLAVNGGRNWSPQAAIENLVLLTVIGAGAATATLLIARRAGASLQSDDSLRGLEAGGDELARGRTRSQVEVPKV
ncbi:MAG: hypothetical protein ACREMU_09660 [Gemmatimonadaceae bacterium]